MSNRCIVLSPVVPQTNWLANDINDNVFFIINTFVGVELSSINISVYMLFVLVLGLNMKRRMELMYISSIINVDLIVSSVTCSKDEIMVYI